ncbi:MAG: hypothetical protein JWM38_558 [Sphingomonas bacterium]|nr:hypothetical protein [Sphingomonas bacterium]MDB5717131.1 hypothetical protein [Sphingomonas bacterium]
MDARLFRVVAIGAAAALAGCAAQTPPTQVTRFHLGQPIAPAEVAVEPRDPTSTQSLEFQTYADAVRGELARNGFRPAPNVARSEVVAVMDLMRGTRPGAPQSAPFSIGLGGGSFGGGVGIGGGLSIPVGKRRSNELVGTELSVQLKRRSDGTVIWEGRARNEARAGTPAASSGVAATKLAAALFQGFPGESGRTILVK